MPDEVVPRGPGGYEPADAEAASVVVGDFWRTLALDDDALILPLTAPRLHNSIGTHPGFSSRLRDSLGVTSEMCDQMGVSSKVRVIEGWMVFACKDLGEDREPVMISPWGPERRHLWALWTVVTAGRWTVGGIYIQPVDGWPKHTTYIDLSHALSPTGPVQ